MSQSHPELPPLTQNQPPPSPGALGSRDMQMPPGWGEGFFFLVLFLCCAITERGWVPLRTSPLPPRETRPTDTHMCLPISAEEL